VRVSHCIWPFDCAPRVRTSRVMWLSWRKLKALLLQVTPLSKHCLSPIQSQSLTFLPSYRQTQTSAGTVTRKSASWRSNASALMCSVQSIVSLKTTIALTITSVNNRRKLLTRTLWYRIRRWRRCSDSTDSRRIAAPPWLTRDFFTLDSELRVISDTCRFDWPCSLQPTYICQRQYFYSQSY